MTLKLYVDITTFTTTTKEMHNAWISFNNTHFVLQKWNHWATGEAFLQAKGCKPLGKENYPVSLEAEKLLFTRGGGEEEVHLNWALKRD